MDPANLLIKNAAKFIGVSQGSATHRQIIDGYNRIIPRPVGYIVKYTDDWCGAFVTYIADLSGLSHLIGRECGVQRHLDIFKRLGIWRNKLFPMAGDIVVFDWDQNAWSDHIGFVEKVDGHQITTIEGNSNGRVARNTYHWTDGRIMGYARPKYETVAEITKTIDDLAQEVIAGRWSQGQERISRLVAAGYDAIRVQDRVNQLMSVSSDETSLGPVLTYAGASLSEKLLTQIMDLAQEYDILPSFLLVVLHFEGLWGTSKVAQTDNNWAGMTWSANYVGNPSIDKRRGSARPTSEGGYYIRYESVSDFLADWVYLFRTGGSYKVAGQKSFDSAVAGMFRTGGAKYDYARLGYPEYRRRILARYQSINKANPSRLADLDRQFQENISEEENMKIKVKIAPNALHWQTGQQIPSWVKDLEFDILDDKDITSSRTAYLLGNQGIPIGWLWEQDLAGK